MRRTDAEQPNLKITPRPSAPSSGAPGQLGGPSVEVPVPLWAAASGLSAGVIFCGLAAVSTSPFETVALLAGAAAAGGLGVYGLVERVARRNASMDWAESGEARALIDSVDDPMVVLDRFGVVVAANSAAHRIGRGGRSPHRAAHMLGRAQDPEQVVYRLLGAALGGRPAEAVVETRDGVSERVSAWPIGGGLALWRQSSADEKDAQTREPSVSGSSKLAPAASAPLGDAAPEGTQIGWFRLDNAGRIIESDGVFKLWLGSRAKQGVEAPPLKTVLPGANLPKGGAHTARSRLIGAAGAPQEVVVFIAPLGRGDEWVGVASPAEAAVAAAEVGGSTTTRTTAAPTAGDGLFHAAPYGVLLLDSNGRIRSANLAAERMFYAMGAEGNIAGASGDFLVDWIVEKDAPRARHSFARALTGASVTESTARVEWTDRSKDRPSSHDPREIEIVFRPYGGRSGKEQLVAAFIQDASELSGLERNVAQAQKLQAVGELAGGVAHDFNNMLTIIIGGCDTLAARKTMVDPDNEELNVIRQSALRAAKLVSQLLAYSRKQRLEPVVANLTEIISDYSFMLNRLLDARCFLHRDLAENLWPVLIDVNQIEQAVMNLVVNARDAMSGAGKIIVRTQNVSFETPQRAPNFTMPAGEYVRMDVIDEGPGVPPEIQAKIFEPFFTTKKVGQGTGLGLSMVYGMVKQSQGFLLLDSEPGKGAAFSIYLPRASEEAVQAAAEAARIAAARAEAAAALAPEDKTILLVDDEAAVRSIAAKALQSRGYEVIEAGDGSEAMEILDDESIHIDLLLSDVVMPDVDGPSLLKQLGDRRPEMNTVFMTGYARDNFAETLEDAFSKRRSFGVLQKPFSLEDLRKAVAEALGAEEAAHE